MVLAYFVLTKYARTILSTFYISSRYKGVERIILLILFSNFAFMYVLAVFYSSTAAAAKEKN